MSAFSTNLYSIVIRKRLATKLDLDLKLKDLTNGTMEMSSLSNCGTNSHLMAAETAPRNNELSRLMVRQSF